jgi:hypothetical protein
LLFSIILFVFFSCNIPEEESKDENNKNNNQLNLTQIDLNLTVSSGVTGTLTIELRDENGNTPVIWSNTVNTNTLINGSNWNSFIISGVKLIQGQKYRIYVTRSDTHAPGTNQIIWNSSDSSGDEYPDGVSSSPNAELDFMFKTYNNGILDQQQTVSEYGYTIYNGGSYMWQEFVSGNKKKAS